MVSRLSEWCSKPHHDKRGEPSWDFSDDLSPVPYLGVMRQAPEVRDERTRFYQAVTVVTWVIVRLAGFVAELDKTH